MCRAHHLSGEFPTTPRRTFFVSLAGSMPSIVVTCYVAITLANESSTTGGSAFYGRQSRKRRYRQLIVLIE